MINQFTRLVWVEIAIAAALSGYYLNLWLHDTAYPTTRELFNELKFGKPIKYEVNKKQWDTLIGIVK